MAKTPLYQLLAHKNLAFCVFNRATYSRLQALFMTLPEVPNLHITLILGSTLMSPEFGSAYEYIVRENKSFNIKLLPFSESHPKGPLECISISQEIISHLGVYLAEEKFDAVVVTGDRFETLPAAMCAAYLNIPVIHLQGGEITGNIDERVRHAVTKLSDYHFCATDLSKEYLIQMGESRDRVFHTGCPSLDLFKRWRIKRKTKLEDYILCIFHPDTEKVDEQYEHTKVVLESVLKLCIEKNLECRWFWPNIDPGHEKIRELLVEYHRNNPQFLAKALNKEPFYFLQELAGAIMVVGNSSVGIRECSAIGVPAINIGGRQSIRERTDNVTDVAIDMEEIVSAMLAKYHVHKYQNRNLYGDGRASRNIVSHLLRMQFTKKGPLEYPMWLRFRDDHFNKERFIAHERRKTDRREYNQAKDALAQQGHLPSESGKAA